MYYQKRIYFFCLFFLAALFCFQTDHADGALVAGDNKVTASAPAQDAAVSDDAPPEENTNDNEIDNAPAAEPIREEINNAGDIDPDVMQNSDVSTPAPDDIPSNNPSASNNGKTSARNSAKTTGAAKTVKEKGGLVSIDIFNDLDITFFIKWMAEETGKNFVVDSNVKGKVTIISPRSVTIDEAYKIFESVLEVNGYTTVPSGSVIKIVPMTEARSKSIETMTDTDLFNPDDRLVTQLIPLKYASPDEIKTAFAPFISKNSIMVSYAPTGTLIITDVLSNIKRLIDILEKIDVEGTSEVISVIPLEYAGSETMAKSLTSIFKTTAAKSAKDTSSSIVILSDDRTNSIITLASEVDTLKIKELIKLLDKESPKGEGNIHVYYLQNASAEELAKVLTSIPTSQTSSGTAKEGVKETAVQISKDVQILADKATNSIIINAGKDDYLVLEDIIKKLDITRKMVYIEALIMEVSMTKEFELGVQWYGGNTTGSVDGKDVVTFGSSTSGSNILPSIDTDTGGVAFSSGLSLGVLGDTITIGDLTFPSIAAVVRAYGTNSDVNILSKPQIMTMDNEEAFINVSDNVPYLTSKQETTSGNDYSNYDFKDVGVQLTITPQINQERFVKLKIEQEVSQIVSQTEIGLPTTLKREAKTTVMIKDGQTVVIGGLIDETNSNSSYKVPILGSIPILGYLFRSKTESTDKKNLYIFITPHIIENTEESDEIYENKIGQMDEVKEGCVSMNKGKASQKKDDRLCDLGYSYLQAKNYDKAAEYYEKALKVNPDNPVAFLNMGIIYGEKREFDKAIEMYKKVISLETEERTYDTINPGQTGKKVTDIAKENLKDIEGIKE